jgi:hypothetical protein
MWCCRTALTLGNVHLGRHVALHAEHGVDSTLGHSRIGKCLRRLVHAVLRDLLDLDAGQRSQLGGRTGRRVTSQGEDGVSRRGGVGVVPGERLLEVSAGLRRGHRRLESYLDEGSPLDAGRPENDDRLARTRGHACGYGCDGSGVGL